MTTRNQLILYLYNTSKYDALRYTKASELLSELKESQNCTEEEFYQALKYLEDKNYVEGEVASYRITGDGIEYVERNVINIVRNYEREAVDLQQKGNELQDKNNNFAYYAVILAVIGIILTIVLNFSDRLTAPTNIVSNQKSTLEPSGKSVRILYENIEPNAWFVKPSQIIKNYSLSDGTCPQGDDFQRKISYCRYYRHPNDCQSNQIRGVMVETIFFESDAGSQAYFTNAFASVQNTKPELTNTVGENSYFREYQQPDSHCSNQTNDKYVLVFQRYNAIGVVMAWTVPNSVDDKSIQEGLTQIATELDNTFRENAK